MQGQLPFAKAGFHFTIDLLVSCLMAAVKNLIEE
jgi:hypothetical protein